jgi:GT2 family glycosyltransferase
MVNLQLSIIIVNWNSIEFLQPCLSSVFDKNHGFDFEVIAVDNASTDDSAKVLKEEFPYIQLIQNDKNVGFTKANNQAIREAKGKYVLLLNPDTIMVDQNIFKNWVAFMDDHPEAGASGCKLIYQDGSHQVGDAGFKPTIKTIFNFSFFLSKYNPLKYKGMFLNYNKLNFPAEVDWICGAGFLVRKSILEKVGLMNEDIFMFADDIEWGCRIRECGYKIFYLPQMKIIHLQGGSSEKQKEISKFSYLWLNNIRLLYKYYNKNQPIVLYDLVISSAFLLRSALYFCSYLKSKKEEMKIKSYKMFKYFLFNISNLVK